MSSIFSKTRVAALSIAHSILDKVIDLNSVPAVKQYVRDLEASVLSLETGALAEQRANVSFNNREIITLSGRKTKIDKNIDTLLSDNDPSNDHLAKTLEAELIGLEERLALLTQSRDEASNTVSVLAETVTSLKTKHQMMLSQLHQLESLEQSTRAKESAASALRGAAEVSSAGANVSVDDVAARIRKRGDVANERLSSAMGAFASANERDSAMASVEARLAERKARLSSQKTN